MNKSVKKNYNKCDKRLNNRNFVQYWAGCIQIESAAQIASPPRTTGTLNTEIAAETSSATGAGEVPGDKLAGAVVGPLTDSAGLAELEGMLGDTDGVSVLDGTSAAVGEDAGVLTGVDTGGGVATEGTGADLLIDGVSAGEMLVTGDAAFGDCTGAADGLTVGAEGEDTGELAGEETGA